MKGCLHKQAATSNTANDLLAKWLRSCIALRRAATLAGRKRGQQNRLVINRRLSVFGRRRDDDYRRGGAERSELSPICAWHLVASVQREHTVYVQGRRARARKAQLKANRRARVLSGLKYRPHGRRHVERFLVRQNVPWSKKKKKKIKKTRDIVLRKYLNVEIIISDIHFRGYLINASSHYTDTFFNAIFEITRLRRRKKSLRTRVLLTVESFLSL